MTAPPQEWPTMRTGPFCMSITRWVAVTSSARELRGFWTATAFSPRFVRRGITLAQQEPSAKAPCTSTTVPIAMMLLLFFNLNALGLPPLGSYRSKAHASGILPYRHPLSVKQRVLRRRQYLLGLVGEFNVRMDGIHVPLVRPPVQDSGVGWRSQHQPGMPSKCGRSSGFVHL